MTNLAKSSLKAFFVQSAVPTGTDYANLIDSQVNIAEASAQTMQGALNATEFIAPRVSATNVNVTGILTIGGVLSAGNASMDRISVSAVIASTVSASSVNVAGAVSAASLNVTGDVSAATGTVYASAMRTARIYQGVGIISAAGTTQGAAAILTNVINRGKGVVDSTTTGFAPPANNIGLVQYLYNEGTSANLWPPTGGFINGLPVNTAFPLVASAMVTIIHLTASAMAVK